jgi:hypothetical protein
MEFAFGNTSTRKTTRHSCWVDVTGSDEDVVLAGGVTGFDDCEVSGIL